MAGRPWIRHTVLALLLAGCQRPANVDAADARSGAPLPDAALDAARARIQRQIARGGFPGAALAVGNRDLIQEMTGFGRLHWGEDAPPVDPASTRYDLASLTKVVATTAAVMALVEDGRLTLDDPVRRHLPAFAGGGRDAVTLRQLLSHTGGVRAGAFDFREDVEPARVFAYLVAQPLAVEPGDVLYSDLGFVLLWAAAEAAAGEPLPGYLRRRVWGPLGMDSTAMGLPAGCAPCAPTLHLEAGGPYAGGSYDEVGRRLGGVTGSAGAFSTAADLARFAAMIAGGGRLGGRRVFSPRTVAEFLTPHAGTRALGWEVYCREGIVADHHACEEIYAVGHTGVTGTSLWIDPESGTWVVLLTNRSYLPRAELDMQRFRRRVFEDLIAGRPGGE